MTAAPDSNPFSPDAVGAIVGHMNGDHADDCLRLCQALGGRPDATGATMVGLDADGMDFTVTGPDGEAPARVPWGHPVTERAQVRVEVVRLHDEACALLGVSPGEEH